MYNMYNHITDRAHVLINFLYNMVKKGGIKCWTGTAKN